MPIFKAGLTIQLTFVDWLIGGEPVLNWSSPTSTADHIGVWRNTDDNWAAATRLTNVGGAVTTYSDATAASDGTPYYYWIIGYDATETFAGANHGVVAWQNEWSEIFTPNVTISEIMPIAALTGGFWRSSGALSFTGCLCANDYVFSGGNPNQPVLDYLGLQINNSTGIGLPNFIAAWQVGNSATYAEIPWSGVAGIGTPGGGGSSVSVPNNAGRTDPVVVLNNMPPAFIILDPNSEPTGAPSSSAGRNFGTLSGTNITVSVSYVSPAALADFGQGELAGGVVPPPSGRIAILMTPVPIPLPCIPCCSTAAPICQCGPGH